MLTLAAIAYGAPNKADRRFWWGDDTEVVEHAARPKPMPVLVVPSNFWGLDNILHRPYPQYQEPVHIRDMVIVREPVRIKEPVVYHHEPTYTEVVKEPIHTVMPMPAIQPIEPAVVDNVVFKDDPYDVTSPAHLDYDPRMYGPYMHGSPYYGAGKYGMHNI